MESTNKFNRKATLIGHDQQKETLLFGYTGDTPTLMGTYYLVHNSELHNLRKDIGSLLIVAEEMNVIIEEQEKLIRKQDELIANLIKATLMI
jgi:hypothetical protein